MIVLPPVSAIPPALAAGGGGQPTKRPPQQPLPPRPPPPKQQQPAAAAAAAGARRPGGAPYAYRREGDVPNVLWRAIGWGDLRCVFFFFSSVCLSVYVYMYVLCMYLCISIYMHNCVHRWAKRIYICIYVSRGPTEPLTRIPYNAHIYKQAPPMLRPPPPALRPPPHTTPLPTYPHRDPCGLIPVSAGVVGVGRPTRGMYVCICACLSVCLVCRLFVCVSGGVYASTCTKAKRST